MNESLLEILGYSRSEIVGHACDELGISGRPGSARQGGRGASPSAGAIRAIELQLRDRAGQVRDVSVSMS